MRINEPHSLLASANLASTSKAIARALERLSTGRRVNSPADGAADYRLSLSLDSQVRGIYTANLGINRAMGMVQTADSAISSLIDITQRMQEIATEGANGALSTTERKSLNSELQSLLDEFDRITQSTEFDQIKLLHGEMDNLQIQTGANAGDSMSFSLPELKSSELFEITVGTGDFEETLNLDVGNIGFRTEQTTADVDGDGHDDIIIATGSTYGLRVYLGNGDGTFEAPISQDVQGGGYVRAADFDQDGILDLVSMNEALSDAQIFIGNGDGTFQAMGSVDFGALGHGGVAIGDANNDGYLDLFSNLNSPSLALGNGDGTFQAANTVYLGGLLNADSVELGDFNNDGNIDIVGPRRDSPGGWISVYFGNGDGSFGNYTTIQAGEGNYLAPVGDFDGDGTQDIAFFSNTSGTPDYDYLSIVLSNGDGSFATPMTYVTSGLYSGSTSRDGEVLDVNNDGILDIIGGSGGIKDDVHIFIGNGDGTFKLLTEDADDNVYRFTYGDYNEDGVLDIVNGVKASNILEVRLGVGEEVSALNRINVDDIAAATTLMGVLENTLEKLTEERGNLGVIHSRLERTSAANLLQTETLTQAKSLVVDTDFALETAELVKQQILQQAAVAVQAQANVQLQVVLGLLQFT